MHVLADGFFARHPELSLAALGASANEEALELKPAGVPVKFLPAEHHAEVVRQYRELNQLAFGSIGVPNWVLSDLCLLPGAIGLLRCPARMLEDAARQRLGLSDEGLAIGAAYYAAPSVVPAMTCCTGMPQAVSATTARPTCCMATWASAMKVRRTAWAARPATTCCMARPALTS